MTKDMDFSGFLARDLLPEEMGPNAYSKEWPKKCNHCKKELDIKRHGWIADLSEDSESELEGNALIHLNCDNPTEKIKCPDFPFDLLKFVYNQTISNRFASYYYTWVSWAFGKNSLKEKLLLSDFEIFQFEERGYRLSIYDSFSKVAKYRYDGWPTKCLRCDNPITPNEKDGALSSVRDDDGLVHWDCALFKNADVEEFLIENTYYYNIERETRKKWNRSGWPDTCIKCGRELNIKKHGWRVSIEHDEEYGTSLKHFNCDDVNQKITCPELHFDMLEMVYKEEISSETACDLYDYLDFKTDKESELIQESLKLSIDEYKELDCAEAEDFVRVSKSRYLK